MLLELANIQNAFLKSIDNFVEFTSEHKLKTTIVNSYNHPFARDYGKLDYPNFLVIKFNEFDNIMAPDCRVGSFYPNINEFFFHFEAFFIVFQQGISTKKTHDNMLLLYSLFADYITQYGQHFIVSIDNKKDTNYAFEIQFGIFSITNMFYSGQLNLKSANNHIAYVCSENFKTRVRVLEYKKTKGG